MIALRAENVTFKAHREVLRRSSSLFHDVLSLPQPPSSDDDVYDGCPLITLQEPAEDVELFLRVLYDGRYTFIAYMMAAY